MLQSSHQTRIYDVNLSANQGCVQMCECVTYAKRGGCSERDNGTTPAAIVQKRQGVLNVMFRFHIVYITDLTFTSRGGGGGCGVTGGGDCQAALRLCDTTGCCKDTSGQFTQLCLRQQNK